MKRYFESICPKCLNTVIGTDDYESGQLCIMGFCKICKINYLEEDLDWEKKI
jgi:hypothetical protein